MKLERIFPWLRRPDQVLVRNREYFSNFDRRQPLAAYDFVVCDTELTGLHKRRDEIISIGAVRISSLQIELSRTFHSLVRPVNIDANQATLVHRITPEQLKQAPLMAEVLPGFIEFCGQGVLVGHFVGLDLHFLNQAAKGLLGGSLASPSVDTMQMVRGYREFAGRQRSGFVDQAGSLVLDDLTREFRLPRFKPHDALEDALQTAYLFIFLAKKLQGLGVRTLQELERLVRSTTEDPFL
ncbi:3'-5' exonuclease [Desulfogranum mediterraneum]|uniref:3'-5' exonuclease n=1 Tax=Desulfogranum mediterraneum TaxID=160661 RepID=UPI0003FBEC67|nr:3'-5' exonuclease [Desulfogranum mediterraneum]